MSKIPRSVGFSKLGRMGRLGNQLWQAASTIGIAKTMKCEVRLPASWDYRPYFSVPDEYFSDLPADVEADATALTDYLPPEARGYLQDYNLFKDIKDEIFLDFQPSRLAWDILNEKYAWFDDLPKPVLSLHVRRQDNVPENDPGTPHKELYHPLRPISYYLRAIEMMEGQYKTILCFSDDISWCEEEFKDIPMTFWHGGAVRLKEHMPGYETESFSDWHDLFGMSFCDFHVLSNSSYAWWGAYLAGDEKAIYSFPPYGPNLSMIDANLMYPPEWIRVDI